MEKRKYEVERTDLEEKNPWSIVINGKPYSNFPTKKAAEDRLVEAGIWRRVELSKVNEKV